MTQKYTLAELTTEEGDAFTKEMTELLEKHNVEVGVKSTIEILKRVEVKEDGVPTPYTDNGESNTTEETPEAN